MFGVQQLNVLPLQDREQVDLPVSDKALALGIRKKRKTSVLASTFKSPSPTNYSEKNQVEKTRKFFNQNQTAYIGLLWPTHTGQFFCWQLSLWLFADVLIQFSAQTIDYGKRSDITAEVLSFHQDTG